MKEKIYCHTCDGGKTVTEFKYPSKEAMLVPCPECNGKGWVNVEVKPLKETT